MAKKKATRKKATSRTATKKKATKKKAAKKADAEDDAANADLLREPALERHIDIAPTPRPARSPGLSSRRSAPRTQTTRSCRPFSRARARPTRRSSSVRENKNCVVYPHL